MVSPGDEQIGQKCYQWKVCTLVEYASMPHIALNRTKNTFSLGLVQTKRPIACAATYGRTGDDRSRSATGAPFIPAISIIFTLINFNSRGKSVHTLRFFCTFHKGAYAQGLSFPVIFVQEL